MGLIRAAISSAGGVLADQWKEYFVCDSIPATVLVRKGVKKTSIRSSNTKGSDNVISNGSGVVVADGQCMVIVDGGKVAEFCAEPGEYTYDASSEASLFDGGKLGANIKEVFKNIGKRIGYGGEAPKDQRVYYFNIKEIIGNKYGTANPVPFRVVDERAGIDIDITLKCFGEYSFKITNPILFYTNVCGNVTADYDRDELANQMRTEMLTALQPALAKISAQGVRYSEIPAHTAELAKALNDELSAKWKDLRGIEIISCGVSSVCANEEDERLIKELQRNVAFADPSRAAAYMVGSTGQAMQDAARNGNGSVGAFMGMGMAQQAGGVNVQGLFEMAKNQGAGAEDKWFCPSCGKEMHGGNFCSACGAKKPQ